MNYEYKVVGAPEKPRRVRGAKSGSDRLAVAFEEVLREEAVDGWEYLRTDTLPITEKTSWFAHPREVRRAVMVFRRPVDAVWQRPAGEARQEPAQSPDQSPAQSPAQSPTQSPDGRREPSLGPAPRQASGPEPSLGANPDRRLAEIVRGPGAGPKES